MHENFLENGLVFMSVVKNASRIVPKSYIYHIYYMF